MFSFLSCSNNSKKCFNSQLEHVFTMALKSIEVYYSVEPIKNDSLYSIDGSRVFLELVTGIQSSVMKTNFGIYYADPNDLKKDIEKWNSWFEEYKCHINLTQIKELYESYRRKQIEERKLLPIEIKSTLSAIPDTWESLLIEGVGETQLE